jgi:hypothetical protein
MNVLLQDILKEIENPSKPETEQKTQIYMDLDGVMVDLEGGFKKITGYTVKDFKNAPQFRGDEKAAKRKFWQTIHGTPNFWVNLEPMPDALVLWNYVKRKYTDPMPVVLSAGQGADVQNGKTKWVHSHLGNDVTVYIAPAGSKKPEFVLKDANTRHILIDDTIKNIELWNNPEFNRFGILHKNAAESIRLLTELDK